MKGVFVGVGVKGVRSLSLVDWTSTAKLFSAAFQLKSVAAEHLLDGYGALYRSKVNPMFVFHKHLLLA
jgi:hypothetical protein